jgi:hypothetical protein
MLANLILADAAQAAGRVTMNVVLLLFAVLVFLAYRRRRAAGERAAAWLVALSVLSFMVLGMLVSATQG